MLLLALGNQAMSQSVTVSSTISNCMLIVTLECGDADCNSSVCSTLCVGSGPSTTVNLCTGCGDWTYFTVCASTDAVCSGTCTNGADQSCVTVSPNGCGDMPQTASVTTNSGCLGCIGTTINVDASVSGQLTIN